MDFTGKNLEVVDFGGEVDYSGHQWFLEPPPRPEVKIMFCQQFFKLTLL